MNIQLNKIIKAAAFYMFLAALIDGEILAIMIVGAIALDYTESFILSSLAMIIIVLVVFGTYPIYNYVTNDEETH